ncbi:MAG: tandem-95 repeat protein, partial [Desulfobacterales bacterium]|nr:tandem-95 repeat protein [Candidatus Desulfatibia vada]
MLRKMICLLAVLFIIAAVVAPVYASGQTVFGPKLLRINRWHVHASFHRFKADKAEDGIITITKNTLNKKIRGGLLLVNGRYIPVRKFLRGGETVFETRIKLQSKNRLMVFFRGTPGASITIKIRKDKPGPPIQVDIAGDPEVIKRGEASILTWTSGHAKQVSIDQGIGSVPRNGSVEVSPTETTTYTITAQRNKWTVTDSVTVTVINSPPIAEPQTVTLNEDTAVSITLFASDVDEDTLTYQVVAGVSNGSLSGTPPNLTYIPNADYYGSDSFTFKANDGKDDSGPTTVSITVHPVNDPPVAVDDTVTTDEDLTVTTGNVLSNDTDVDGDTLTVSSFTQPANGAVVNNGNGTFSYTPNSNFNGTDSFYYTLNDGKGGTDTAIIVITIKAVNDAPIANDQSITLNEDDSLAITLTGADIDGDSLIYQIIGVPSHGMLSGTAPNLTYNPAENYNGSDSFTFKVNDGSADSDPATMTIAVSPVNDAPMADAGLDQTVFRSDTAVLDGSGSGDIDGDVLTYLWSFISVPPGSTASITDPTLVNPGFVPDVSGTYEIQLTVNDGTPASATDTITITANPRMVQVPDVVNLTQADAKTAILVKELTIGAIDTENNDTVSADHVVSQNPLAGTYTEEGSPVDLVVSLGPAVPLPPVVSISAAPNMIQIGGSATLNWSSADATSCFIEPEIGSVSVNGTTTVSPTATTTYTITVTGPNGSDGAQVVVAVLGNPEPLPEGSFGAQYEDLVPPDATVEEYDAKRFSLITGLVHTPGGDPISDVAVTIHSHPEYGTAATDANGQFSLPLEGGTTKTVVYQKEGLITVQRKVYVPWNDTAIAETAQMISQDPVATIIAFDGDPGTVITHQSTEVADESGSRSTTMVFTGDNHAYLIDEYGNDVHELTTITTRATEFTTPESMPAKLPPNSAYTYCVELGVDGARRVRFEKPVITWVDNFLGFDVGEIAPVGYYDRDRGVWVPSDNGVVVKLLDTNNDDIVDALDADGDDLPDDLDEDGSFNNEVAGLDDALRYPPNSTFWRFAVAHFSSWDINWGFGPPADAVYSNAKGMATANQQNNEAKTCKLKIASFVEERSRIFHEDIPIPGTDMTLHYASNRVGGYKTEITVPASGETVPDSLKSIIVEVEVAGRVLEQTLDPLPNQNAEFVWDGLDHLGKSVATPTTAHISVGFVYDGAYQQTSKFGYNGNGTITGSRTRQEVILWKRSSILIQVQVGVGTIAKGWTVSLHHSLSPVDPSTLFKGNGTIIKTNIDMIDTVAGNGTGGHSGDNGPATDARFSSPYGVAVDSTGNLYISDSSNSRIRKVDSNGVITTAAGNGNYGYSGDNGPATNARLNDPYGLAVDNAGNLYIADALNHRIRKVDTSGVITTVAGNGSWGYSGDNGPATDARLYYPEGVAVDNAGNLYIADDSNHRIRKVDTSGVITTVAGNGSGGYSGDNGPATNARLYYPRRVAVDNAGNLYIADYRNHRIRKVDTNGVITTVAGNGNWGCCGDNGPAIDANLNYPKGVAVDNAGNLYIADTDNQRIRKVDTNGVITTVAGNGSWGYSGDNGPATDARLNIPQDVAVDSAGNRYIADTYNSRVRKVEMNPGFFIGAMAGGDIPFAEENGLGHIMSDSGRHKTTIDLDTGIVLRGFGYDPNDNLISITDQFGNQINIQRDGNGTPTAIISADGLSTGLIIDGNSRLTQITYPDGNFYEFKYMPNDLMFAKTEPEGNRFEHTFDSNGRLTDATDQEGGSWNYTRTVYENNDIVTEVTTAEGNITSYLDHTYSTGAYESTITGPTGAETLFTQSADGLTVNKSLPCGMELEFEYDLDPEYKFKVVKEMTESTPAALEKVTSRDKTYTDTDSNDTPDLITETVTVNSKTTSLANNILLFEKTITSPEARTITTQYDPATLLTESVSVPGLFDTSYGYDARGRLNSINTNTRETSFTYNAQGFLESVADPESHTTVYAYDAAGRITAMYRPDTTHVYFTYDNNGNMTVLTNPSAIDHGFGFNKVNLKSSYHTPLSGSYSYIYDKDRRLIQTNFPSGNQINNIYVNGRLEQTQTPEGTIDYTYLCSTKIDSIINGTDSITYGYDGKLVTSETLTGTLSQSLGYTYNNDFNLTGFTYAGNTTSFIYDNDGLLTGTGSFTITRNAQNGLPESVINGALSLSRSFNGYGEVSDEDYTVSGQGLTSWNLVRDNNGRITNKTETVGGTTSDYIYTYDPMGRLLTVTKDSALIEEYDYDANGTRIYEMNALRGISGRNFSYDDEDHLLSADSVIYSYNLDGFLTAKTDGSEVTTYAYSSRGELLSVTLPNATVIEYLHDPLGRRIAKKVNGTTVEKYLWQGLTRLLAVYDGSDNLIVRFEYADARIPVAMQKNGITYYLTYDQVGSLRIVADASGNVVKKVEYDSFGNIINDTDPSFEVPFGFAGGLHDRDTGLVRFGYRDYDPDTGRWTAKDPIFFAGGDSDLYGYCLNNPINITDPLGLINWTAVRIGAIATLGGGVGVVGCRSSRTLDLTTHVLRDTN